MNDDAVYDTEAFRRQGEALATEAEDWLAAQARNTPRGPRAAPSGRPQRRHDWLLIGAFAVLTGIWGLLAFAAVADIWRWAR